jgi:hypothetical protein
MCKSLAASVQTSRVQCVCVYYYYYNCVVWCSVVVLLLLYHQICSITHLLTNSTASCCFTIVCIYHLDTCCFLISVLSIKRPAIAAAVALAVHNAKRKLLLLLLLLSYHQTTITTLSRVSYHCLSLSLSAIVRLFNSHKPRQKLSISTTAKSPLLLPLPTTLPPR